MGTYGYDKAFLEKNKIDILELKSTDGNSKLLISPAWQGRVVTSSAAGDEGSSFGWINYSLVESGKTNPKFNPFGGEERLWLGPEGGPFSVYFRKGLKQDFVNWCVPSVIDTEPFDIISRDEQSVAFFRQASLTNASGTDLKLNIERNISLLSPDDVSSKLGINIPSSLKMIAYETNNKITNTGEEEWTKESGVLSIWMLSMLNSSLSTTVFIPYKTEVEGLIVNDDYFGKVPVERLIVDEGIIFFQADGKLRSKIGIPPGRAKNICGSYNSESKVLTLIWFNLPSGSAEYLNGKWGEQDNPFAGDAVNSYNDGPLEDGSVMGPFYELETSSPAALLKPLESLSHIQNVIHLQGDEKELGVIVNALFSIELSEIAGKF